MPEVPKLLGGRYEVGELLGRGGMAEVHRRVRLPARPPGRHQDAAQRPRPRPDLPQPVPPRGAVGGRAQPRLDRRRLRPRRGRPPSRPAAPRSRCPTSSWSTSTASTLRQVITERGTLAAHRGAADHRGRPRRARLQPPQRHRPPRHQAGQRHDRRRRHDQGDGLRHRPGHGRRQRDDDPDPGRHRHGPVPLARAGPGPAGRRALGPVLHRLHALRAAHRTAAVPRREPGLDRLPARRRAARRRRRATSRDSPTTSTPSCSTRSPSRATPATRPPPSSAPTCRPCASAGRSATPPAAPRPPSPARPPAGRCSAPPPPRPSRARRRRRPRRMPCSRPPSSRLPARAPTPSPRSGSEDEKPRSAGDLHPPRRSSPSPRSAPSRYGLFTGFGEPDPRQVTVPAGRRAAGADRRRPDRPGQARPRRRSPPRATRCPRARSSARTRRRDGGRRGVSTVQLTVSTGPTAVTVPDVTGRTFSEAKALLERPRPHRRRPSEEVDDPEDREGQDHRLQPGRRHVRGAPTTTIILRVGTGKVAVPNVVGKSRDEAQRLLAAANLQVEDRVPRAEHRRPRATSSRRTRDDGTVDIGSTVTIVVAQKPAPTVTPDDGTPTPTPDRRPTDARTADPLGRRRRP